MSIVGVARAASRGLGSRPSLAEMDVVGGGLDIACGGRRQALLPGLGRPAVR